LLSPPRTEAEREEDRKAMSNAQLMRSLIAPYLAEQFGYKRNHVTGGLGPVVTARTAKYDLYLRVTPSRGPWGGGATLVIARIEFKPTRKGHGRRFMAFLVECADLVGYDKIGIESTNEESEAFGAKFGLVRHGDGNNLLGTVEQVNAWLAEQNA
jgi:hypothetical protein